MAESRLIRWRRPGLSLVGILVLYYAVPIGREGGRVVVGLAVTAVAVVLLAWAIIGQVRRQFAGGESETAGTLVTLLSLVVVVFAASYYMLERTTPGEVVGLETRTDSLYFTLSTLATVGFGDIHAKGQIARSVVSVQLVFDVVFVATLASLMTTRLRHRISARVGRSETSRRSEDPR
jgi:voltage-gated potassium channel